MSPITIASAANSSGCDGGKVLNALPTSSWPSITTLIPTGGLPVPGAQRADVHEDVRLRVGRAASVDRAVALGRLERRRLPLRLVADRHDVVVAVQQHGRRAGGRRDLAHDDGRGVRAARADRGSATPASRNSVDDVLVRLEQRRMRRLGVVPAPRSRGSRRAARGRPAAAASACAPSPRSRSHPTSQVCSSQPPPGSQTLLTPVVDVIGRR